MWLLHYCNHDTKAVFEVTERDVVLLRGASDQKTFLCVIQEDAEKRHILLFNFRELVDIWVCTLKSQSLHTFWSGEAAELVKRWCSVCLCLFEHSFCMLHSDKSSLHHKNASVGFLFLFSLLCSLFASVWVDLAFWRASFSFVLFKSDPAIFRSLSDWDSLLTFLKMKLFWIKSLILYPILCQRKQNNSSR